MIHSPSSSKNRNCCQNEEKINPQRPGAKLDAVIQGGGKQTVWATLTKKVNSEGFSAREKKKPHKTYQRERSVPEITETSASGYSLDT